MICAAYEAIERDYNVGGILRERPSNMRRREATGIQLARIGWAPGLTGWPSDSVKTLYDTLETRYGFKVDCACGARIDKANVSSHLSERLHHATLYREVLLESGWATGAGTPQDDPYDELPQLATARGWAKRLLEAGFPVIASRTAHMYPGEEGIEIWSRQWMLALIAEAKERNVSRKQITKLIGVWARHHQDPVKDPPDMPEILRVKWP